MKHRWVLVATTFAFPLGMWLLLLGYEIQSAACLFAGWLAMTLLAEEGR